MKLSSKLTVAGMLYGYRRPPSFPESSDCRTQTSVITRMLAAASVSLSKMNAVGGSSSTSSRCVMATALFTSKSVNSTHSGPRPRVEVKDSKAFVRSMQ